MHRILKLSACLGMAGACTPPADPNMTRDTSSAPGDSGSSSVDTSIAQDSAGQETAESGDTSDTGGLDSGPNDSGIADTAIADTGSSDTGVLPTEEMADFSLTDLNSTSHRYGQPVSPRDYLEQVSGWYFAHAT